MWCDVCNVPCMPQHDLCHKHRQEAKALARERRIKFYYTAKRLKTLSPEGLRKLNKELFG